MPGEPGQRRRHQPDTQQGDQTHAEQPGRQFAAREAGQCGGDGEEDRAVRRRALLPHRRHLVGERPAELRRAVRVHVDVRVDHRALREIAVHIAAEQRWREQQRRRPDGQNEQQGPRSRRFGAAYDGAEQRPCRYQQDDAEVHADQAEYGLGGLGGEELPRGQGSGRLTAESEKGGAGQTESLTAAEIDGKSHGQHSGSVSTPSGRKATYFPPDGGLRVTSV